MRYDIFLAPLLISFVVAMMLLAALVFLGRKYSCKDLRISKRHGHKKGVSRFGGVALIVSFVAAIFLDKNLVMGAPLVGVLFGAVTILILGVTDDLKQISWKSQLFFQLIIVMVVSIMGVHLEYVTNPFGGIFLLDSGFWQAVGLLVSLAWVVFIMNAMNWVDGVDGLVGGITLIGMATIFFLSLRPEVNQPPLAIIAAAFIGGLLAFIFFNFHPAKILAGTSGSIFMGFFLASMAIFAGAKIATTLLVLAVPIIDALWVIGERLYVGESIFSPDKRHLHFRLMELGWSVKKICFFYYAVTILVAVVALNTFALGKAACLLIIALGILGILFVIRRKVIFMQNNQKNAD